MFTRMMCLTPQSTDCIMFSTRKPPKIGNHIFIAPKSDDRKKHVSCKINTCIAPIRN